MSERFHTGSRLDDSPETVVRRRSEPRLAQVSGLISGLRVRTFASAESLMRRGDVVAKILFQGWRDAEVSRFVDGRRWRRNDDEG